MTTIATDGRSMAGDGLATANRTICARQMVKVHRLSDGSLYGACGDDGDGQRHQAWVEGGCVGQPPEKMESGFGFLVLRPNGELFEGSENGILCPIDAPFAIGSGFDVAVGAMDMGADAERAIEITSQRDVWTGGKITVLHLEPALSVVEAA